MMTTLEILKAARALIADPANWCQRQLQDRDGRCCARGAVFAAAGVSFWDEPWSCEIIDVTRALDAAALKLDNRHSIVDVNDQIGHAAVMRCYDAAITKLEGNHND